MKAIVSEQGLFIPRELLKGIQAVEIHKHQNVIVIVPIAEEDPILQLGKDPIVDTIMDASVNHDHYIYG
jgi:virulence-associated protein VagC